MPAILGRFTHDGRDYAFDRIDALGNIHVAELVLMGGKPTPAGLGPVAHRYDETDLFAVVKPVGPPSPFAGEGKSYGPDTDGYTLRIRIPKWEHVSDKVPRSHVVVEVSATDFVVPGAYVDPARLAADLAEHLKSVGAAMPQGA